MKILLACQQSAHTYPIPAYGFWRTYFIEGLREAGHEVVEVPEADWARGLLDLPAGELASWREQTWARVLAMARQIPGLDLFLGYLYPQQVEPSAVAELTSLGVPAVNFFCDNVREYRRLPREFAPFTLHWVPEYAALALYAERHWKTVFAPMPCWVPPELRHLPTAEERVVRFIGRGDDLRRALLSGVGSAGLPLAVYGRGWTTLDVSPSPLAPTFRQRVDDWANFYRRQGPGRTLRRLVAHGRPAPATAPAACEAWLRPSPQDADYARLLAGAAVALGINRFPDVGRPGTFDVYSRLRDIEAPMLGACYLTEWAPELPERFELGREIEIYHDSAELIDKARALLANDAHRTALRVAGQRRALAEHTVGHTVSRIAHALGLSTIS